MLVMISTSLADFKVSGTVVVMVRRNRITDDVTGTVVVMMSTICVNMHLGMWMRNIWIDAVAVSITSIHQGRMRLKVVGVIRTMQLSEIVLMNCMAVHLQ